MTKKKKAISEEVVSRETALKRKHRECFLLNDKEREAIDAYCKKYKVKNRSQFVRETIMKAVMESFLEDYPTLFDKKDLDKMIV